MSREIKFRMWNSCGEASKMFYDTEQVMECLKQQIQFGTHPQRGYNHIEHGSAFMQFTGKKDKNGIDIYEGDINQDNGVVIWNKDDASFCWEYKDVETMAFENEYTWCEIAGNIWQNPELLKKC